jgi:hypothetical protein
LFLLVVCLNFACKKDLKQPDAKPAEPIKPITYTSNQARNLNVVYFVPADLSPYADYERRISEIMLAGQKYFAEQMNWNGYGSKTFGLLKDDANARVKIITIKGKLSRENYKAETHNNALQEINAYFSANPSEKSSDHTLIILPALYLNANSTLPMDGVNPYFGIGKSCYVLDYPNFDYKYFGTDTYEFTKWYGGLFHELGHALNLPHNHAKKSEMSVKGTALMGAGNYTLGKTPTFLTAADCAVLDVNQVFNADTKAYYAQVNAGITSIEASYNSSTSAINVSGKFSSEVPVKQILYYNDPETIADGGTGANKDYNAITWTSKPIGSNEFKIDFLLSDFIEKTDGLKYELRVKLVHENGHVTQTSYNYLFNAGIPILDFSTKPEINKQGWKISSFSSEESSGEGTINGRANTLIDGNGSTYWHSKWTGSSTSYPHDFVVDMGVTNTVKGFTLIQRSGLSRAIKDFELLSSVDGVSFVSIKNFTAANTNGNQYFTFDTSRTFRYFKVVSKSAWDGQAFAAIAEVGMF